MSPLRFGEKEIELAVGKTIFDYADTLKVRVPTSCGRSGKCHECIVEIREGMDALTPVTEPEGFLRDNYRLACQAAILDCKATVEFAVLRRQPRILTDFKRSPVGLNPTVVRIRDGIFRDEKRIDHYKGSIFGLAIDVGTTTVVLNLVDMETGEIIYTASFENPQRFGGSDIMHRISYNSGTFEGELQQIILSAVNFEIGDMTRKLKIHRRLIYDVVVVGNSTMRDIFFGIDTQPMGEKPYKSLTELEFDNKKRDTTAISTNALELGLRVFPDANVYSGPLLGSHIGSDVAADILAVKMYEKEESSLLIDVGTNTEVVIGNKHRMLAASCPAGPAFEGGEITYGMPGYNGAIEAIEINGSNIRSKIIGNIPPQGICGSGLVDLLAELRRNNMMNELGVFTSGGTKFYFAPEHNMYLSRADISALAQAKSANYSGQWILIRQYGLPTRKISKAYLAGGFANYINVKNAIEIGFITNMPVRKIQKVGNASLQGATKMLLSKKMRDVAEQMVQRVEHVELETTNDFFDIFVEGCMFKPMQQIFE